MRTSNQTKAVSSKIVSDWLTAECFKYLSAALSYSPFLDKKQKQEELALRPFHAACAAIAGYMSKADIGRIVFNSEKRAKISCAIEDGARRLVTDGISLTYGATTLDGEQTKYAERALLVLRD